MLKTQDKKNPQKHISTIRSLHVTIYIISSGTGKTHYHRCQLMLQVFRFVFSNFSFYNFKKIDYTFHFYFYSDTTHFNFQKYNKHHHMSITIHQKEYILSKEMSCIRIQLVKKKDITNSLDQLGLVIEALAIIELLRF